MILDCLLHFRRNGFQIRFYFDLASKSNTGRSMSLNCCGFISGMYLSKTKSTDDPRGLTFGSSEFPWCCFQLPTGCGVPLLFFDRTAIYIEMNSVSLIRMSVIIICSPGFTAGPHIAKQLLQIFSLRCDFAILKHQPLLANGKRSVGIHQLCGKRPDQIHTRLVDMGGCLALSSAKAQAESNKTLNRKAGRNRAA